MQQSAMRAVRLISTFLVLIATSFTTLAQPGPSVSLTKTVSTDSLTCGTESIIQVDPGTTVYYCYTILNDGGVTLTSFDLEDSDIGVLFSGFMFPLTPGALFSTVDLNLEISAVIDSTTVNTGTVVAGVEGGGTVQDSDQAAVLVGAAPGPAVPIPTLSALGLTLLAGLLLLIAARRRFG